MMFTLVFISKLDISFLKLSYLTVCLIPGASESLSCFPNPIYAYTSSKNCKIFFSNFFFKFSFYNSKILFETILKIFIFKFLIFNFLFYEILNLNHKSPPLNSKP